MSYNTSTISLVKLTQIFNDVSQFITTHMNFISSEISSPFSSIQHDDEEVCLIWIGNSKFQLAIGFSGKGTYDFWFKNLETQQEFDGSYLPVTTLLPNEIINLIKE